MSRPERQFPRYALEAAVEIRPHGGGSARRGRTSNVSRGGLCAVIDAAVPVGRIVEVEVALVFAEGTFSEPLALPARTVWCTDLGGEGHQIGLSFQGLLAGQREYLELFLRFLDEGAAQRRTHADREDDPFGT
jgi:PilZ domain